MNDQTANKGNIQIGEGVTITGTVDIPGKAVINGILNGELHADELVVGKDGRLNGTVSVNKAEIHGTTHESLTVRDHLTLRSTGRVHGKVVYGEIEIERGGQISGTVGQPNQTEQQVVARAIPGTSLPTLVDSVSAVIEES